MNRMHEDYVRAIWTAREWAGEPVTVSRLAAHFGTTRATASANLRSLVEAGLVTQERYGRPGLTSAGEELAVRMVRRHRILETWAHQVLGFPMSELDQEVEHLEHSVSDRLIERLAATLDHPTVDPHGDPIPSVHGQVDYPEGHRLAAGDDGWRRLVRIDDDHPGAVDKLTGLGFAPGDRMLVRVLQGGARVAHSDGGHADLGSEEMTAVIVADL